MKTRIAIALVILATAPVRPQAQGAVRYTVIDLWTQGKPAFGVFVPNEGDRTRPVYTREGGERLAVNPLYDFVFLNLEGAYDAAAVKAIAAGLRSRAELKLGATGSKATGSKGVSRKTLIVRIPPIEKDGSNAAAARVKEVLAAGADGVTIPHIQSVDEAKQAIGFFRAARASVWSPSNARGRTLAMLMIEDPGALVQAKEIADVKGYSILACGIGSLTAALGGNREAGEAGTQKVLAESKRAKLVNMLTATTQDVEKRVKEGFLGILAQGRNPDEAIALGRAAAGR